MNQYDVTIAEPESCHVSSMISKHCPSGQCGACHNSRLWHCTASVILPHRAEPKIEILFCWTNIAKIPTLSFYHNDVGGHKITLDNANCCNQQDSMGVSVQLNMREP